MADFPPIHIPDSVKERFWQCVNRRGPDECWPWTGRLNRKGYGAFGYNRRGYNASRFSLIMACGFVPDSTTHACHSCDNPACCNPSHLRWASHSENMKDAVERNRLWGKGAKTHCHRGHPLTRETIYFDKTGHRHGCILCAREKGRLRKMGITDAAVRLPIEDLQPLRSRKTFLIADRCRDLRQNS